MPFYQATLRAQKPDRRYPLEPKTLGDHVRKRRLDLGLLQRQVARKVGAHLATITNWETGKTEPELKFLPAVIAFLGFDPRPEGRTFGERLYRTRTARGMSHRVLARLVGANESTVWKWELGRHRPASRLALVLEGLFGDLLSS